jgi:hypothetical protein
MYNPMLDFDPRHEDLLDGRSIARQQERLSNLQYIVALLLEKNEQMRQQLAAKNAEDRAWDPRATNRGPRRS